ncbi:AMP-binding enzyme family protein (macronuclear) [Tetrahymena thermophila SB210]|uniref:AMP-binding enzyme family protein n=1 Tax=Tetrahymena thermophila (strain SB210) TaxID=312017 RepID=I7LZW9_TETTS|nr:AMP-binding enzyme family protein [Tetrahymena thermophila SB210]EAR85060.3 AMP-binding enzyme family protein [Tetrahymena thermophila SB210]|eukprot:XP_001032723.3 AMP-binding enzyme family protein [Tetrahymena thermophila SB210]
MKLWKKIDIFSEQFIFNIEDKDRQKKATFLGLGLSTFVFIATLGYFIYQLILFSTNQIQPIFRQQSFIQNDLIQTELNNELVAFKMDSGDFVYQPNKTYLVFMAYFFQQGQNRTFIQLNAIDCQSKDLQGYKCLDFSQVSNQTFSLNTLENLYSQIQIFAYGCLDVDKVKTFVPDDCASQDDIDALVNGVNVGLRYKIYTAQYNTTSMKMESDYRNILVYTFASQAIVTFLNMQTQTTNVKQGLIWQQNYYYSSPLQYGQINQSMDRKSALHDGQGPFNSFVLQMDEIVYQIQIQYSTLPQILAIVNGVFSLLMLIGYVGKKFSQKKINDDFLLLFLKNIFSGQYFTILQSSKLLQSDQKESNFVTTYLENSSNLFENKQIVYDSKESDLIKENNNNNSNNKNKQDNTNEQQFEKQTNDQEISLPNFRVKQKRSLEYPQINTQELNNQAQNNTNLQKQYSYRNQFRIKEQEKFSDQQQYKDETSDQETILSPTQLQTLQSSPKNALLKNKNLSQIAFSNYFPQSPNQKSINQKKFINTQSVNEQDSQTQALRRNQSIINSINLKDKIDKLNALQSEQISNLAMQNILKLNKGSKISKEILLGFDSKRKKMVYDQIINDLNIYQLYKDILFLKKAIMVLFSQEQLATLKLLGCSSSFLDLKSELTNLDLRKIQQLRKENKINYLDEQFLIYQSEQLQKQQLEQFLIRVKNEVNINEIDKRLISSLC